jgi:hypothetical protein
VGAVAGILVMVLGFLSACNIGEKKIDDIIRILGVTPGTFYNFGADGQVVFEAKCASMAFERDTDYDVKRWDKDQWVLVEPSSVVKVRPCVPEGTPPSSLAGEE